MKGGETEPFKPKQSSQVTQWVSNCASRGVSCRAVEGDIDMGEAQYKVQTHLHRVRFHFRGQDRAEQVKYLVERQEKGRSIFFDQMHVITHLQSDIGENDTSKIALDLDICCKGIEGADFSPESIKAEVKNTLGLEVKKRHEDKRRRGHDVFKKKDQSDSQHRARGRKRSRAWLP